MDAHVELKPMIEPPGRDATIAYAVCVGRGDELQLSASEQGLDGEQRAHVVRCGGLAALVIAMPSSYLIGAEAEARLADLAWITPRAMRHETLVRLGMACGPVFPLPFGTAFSSVDALTACVSRHAALIDGFLDMVEGCAEFAIRVAYQREPLLAAVEHEVLATSPAPSGPGARYLQQKRARDEASRRLSSHLASICSMISQELRPMARGLIHRRAVADRGDGFETADCLALLAVDDEQAPLHAALDALNTRLSEQGIRVEISGPWPPYSFCPVLEGTP